jgi:hypothetical protein
MHEIETKNTYDASLLLAAPITQVCPCIACKNIDNPKTWISVFLRNTSNTTWEVFDKDFSKIGPKLYWNGNGGLKNMWGCPDAESIQRAQAARMQQDPFNLRVTHRRGLAGSLDKQFAGCSEKSPNTNNNKHESLPVATPSFTSFFCSASRNPASSNADASSTCNNNLQSFLSMHGANLQATLDKHQDNVLHLLCTGTTAGQNTIPKKMLTKFYKANMTTMTQINTLIACAGSKELSTQRLKEFRSITKTAAMELYNSQVVEQNAMEQEPPASIHAPIISDVIIAGQESTAADLQHADNFWQSHLPDRHHILSMDPDGNCFFRCILEQLNHDNGA